jgi:hypothetical protein
LAFWAKPERPWRLEKKFNRQERKELRKVGEDFENSTLDSHSYFPLPQKLFVPLSGGKT